MFSPGCLLAGGCWCVLFVVFNIVDCFVSLINFLLMIS